MRLEEFDFELPERLIAQHPLPDRSASRMMVLQRKDGTIEHRVFRELSSYLKAGDLLVLNNTRVIPARLYGVKVSKDGQQGAAVEVLLLKDLGNDSWETLVRPGKRLQKGAIIRFGDGQLMGEVTDVTETGGRIVRFSYEGIFMEWLERLGEMPLPPYITESLEDAERYQTVYAREKGSAAAPTAGLHFTTELLNELQSNGVRVAYLTLHVGLGTFRPVATENIDEHVMHSEWFHLTEETANLIQTTKKQGGRVFAVGTTACRTLETVGQLEELHEMSGWTDIFIRPGYEFRLVDGLITNFHLPKSTLLMLISALAGRDSVLHAYQVAVEQEYRFFSFGDAMLITPDS